MARTTSYTLDPSELAFAKDFISKRVSKGVGLLGDQSLVRAFDAMDQVVQRMLSGRPDSARAVAEFAGCLRTFNEHDAYRGIVAKLRNAIRVRRYRMTHGSRKASDKTITISHESWALLKTVIRHGGARTLSEAILNLQIPDGVLLQMREGQRRQR